MLPSLAEVAQLAPGMWGLWLGWRSRPDDPGSPATGSWNLNRTGGGRRRFWDHLADLSLSRLETLCVYPEDGKWVS